MALETVKERKEKILKLLSDEKITTIVLVGKSGVGKTWMAREINDHAISNDLFDITLWLFLNRKYDSKALYENIARQLSIFSTTEEWEDNDENEVEGEAEDLEKLKSKIISMLNGKRCLIILDDEGNKTNENEIMSKLKVVLPSNQQNQFKFLITTIERESCHSIEESETVEVQPLSEEDSLHLLRDRSGISVSMFPHFQSLLESINKNSMRLPAAIVMMAEALSYLREHETRVWTLESTLEEATNIENKDINQLLRSIDDMFPRSVITECCWHSRQFLCDHGSVHYNELITYWIMEGYLGLIDHIEKAYEKGHHVLMELVKRGMLKKQEDDSVFMEGAMLKADDQYRCGFGETARLGLGNVFEDDKWEGLGRVAQMDGMIKTLCNGKHWKKISTLLLDGDRLCREIPETFFQGMQGLQVLALFNSRLKSLPLSLSKMEKLRVLVLRGCEFLDNIDQIRELKMLSVLEISGASSLEKIPDDLFEQIPSLRSLNLCAFQITSLPSSLFNLSKLRWLILRGCSRLQLLPSLKAFKDLEVLDLSGATSVIKFHDQNFSSVQNLRILDLSQTQIKKLPFLQNLGKLTRCSLSSCTSLAGLPNLASLSSLQILHLSGASSLKAISSFPSSMGNLYALHLRGCSQLVKLPCTIELKHLKLLDLSDADGLVEIEDKSFKHLIYLQVVNLSKTKLKILPSLSNLGNLRELLLKDCSLLETLPEMEELTRLEVLDLSGASSLRKVQGRHLNHGNLRQLLLSGCLCLDELPHLNALEKLEVLDLSGCSALTFIQDKSFEHMTRLSRLNLSETKIECLPSLSNLSNLCHLLLKDCVKLTTLPPLESLSNLEELDLCGARSLIEIQAEFLEDMTNLRILNLSTTPLVQLPAMSNLVKLSQLSLGGCSNLKRVPNLESLTELEVLDLSGTAIGCPPSLNSLSNLRELLLRDCSSLERLPCLESLRHLEVLDLLGAPMKEFPYGISELTRLKELNLPAMKDSQIDWGKIKFLPENLNWDQSGISMLNEILIESSKPSITLSSTRFFRLLEKNPKLWETCFKQFHFSVCFGEQGKDGDIYFHRDEFIFRDIYFQTRHFPHPKECCRSLEIRGFNEFPDGIKDVLRRAEFVALIENKFINCLSDLGDDNTMNMKGCWIERCTGMKSILCEEDEHVRMGRRLENLWVSNMPHLKSLCSCDVQSESFKNLKSLYLDCCPMLVNVFSSSQVLENLEILQIKFCDKVKTVFGPNTSAECKLQKLRILHVLELPELKNIGGILPSLQNFKARECPMLLSVFSSSQPPESLEILQLKFCDNLETVFEQNTPAVCTLPKLHTLHLWRLPELKSIGGLLPSVQNLEVKECPKLPELPHGVNDEVSQ
ncbi:hypothetical protein L1049_022411 [Liquidambar formosana]|uniref:NB-ARC domain-containing protein n=1 Tax=Liquidambar formosana TaxID=63359 RepID=A0AAP0WNT1_LIQFO